VRAAGKAFAYLKGTDGMSTRDTGDWPAKARAAGVAVGLYGYAQPGSAADQYDLLLQTAMNRAAFDLAPALDLEDPFVPGPAAVQFAIAWLQRAVAVGQLPVYYANDSMMTYTLPAIRAVVPGVWPWIARYGAAPKNSHRTWQYSSAGRVPGITASGVDLDTGDIPVSRGTVVDPVKPVTQVPVSKMEEYVMDPIIHAAVPVTENSDGTKSQIANNQLIHTGAAAVLNVIPLEDGKPCFFGNPAPGAPVFCYGPGGGKGGGHSTVADQNERRADLLNPQQYEIPAGTTRIFYTWSCAGRVAVQVVPCYLLG
jgi:GH25 family lysozyme M1 (1,4-beta-N-acetylmuramidase)